MEDSLGGDSGKVVSESSLAHPTKKGKIKCWVVYDEEYPGGMIFQNRRDALENSSETRWNGSKAYTRVKYFTKADLEEFPEAD